MISTVKRSKNNKKLTIIAVVIILLIAALVVFALEYTNKTHFFHTEQPAPTASQNTKGEVQTNSDKSSNSGSTTDTPVTSPQPNNQKTGSGNSSSTTLVTPTGDFVSAHNIALNTPVTSVCNTTSGATCTITFIKDGVTRSLDKQTTDSGGTSYWFNWTPKSIGLSAGTWKVQANASLNGQTKSAQDAINMVISS